VKDIDAVVVRREERTEPLGLFEIDWDDPTLILTVLGALVALVLLVAYVLA
jgi:hypothetical protein